MAGLYFSNHPGTRHFALGKTHSYLIERQPGRKWTLTIRDLHDRSLVVQGPHPGRDTAIAVAQAFNRLSDDYSTLADRYSAAVEEAGCSSPPS